MMKRWIQSSSNIPTLHVIIELTESNIRIAASDEFEEITHPSVRRKYKKSDEWLKHVNDLVRSILGSMRGRGFHILQARPSKKSYTYYILFQPVDENGDVWSTELGLQLELRDHVSNSHTDLGQVTKNLIVNTYYLEDKSYRDMTAILKELWRIFDDLQN